MQKPIYLNNEIYLVLLESLVIKTDTELKSFSNKESRYENINYILENPSKYLLQECNIFNNPDLLNKVIFDIDDLEYMFDEKSIQQIKEKIDTVTVKRVIDNEYIELKIEDIKKSFDNGCTFDCQSDK